MSAQARDLFWESGNGVFFGYTATTLIPDRISAFVGAYPELVVTCVTTAPAPGMPGQIQLVFITQKKQ
ncbi:MAG: hypothetical protein Q8S35_02945 [bacterium]|nr:hypothetical protein [bacterium]